MAVRERIRKVKHLQNKFFVCVLENPDLPINAATAIRNICAFGVTKLYVVGGPSLLKDFETSRSNKYLTKISSGASKWVFVKRFETTAECIAHLKKDRFTSVVTSSHVKGKNNIDLYEGEFTQKRLAVWFGNEKKGISDEAIENAEACIRIPMGGVVESLNLGTSTGIVLSYISYQRLKFVFDHRKIRTRPKGLRRMLLSSWKEFINPKRD